MVSLRVVRPRYRRHLAMPPLRRPRHAPKPDRRRALELLAASPDSCTEAIMLAHGFTVEQMVELVHARLATATAERMVARSRKIEAATLRVTEAGRKALGNQQPG
jgi:hypothetical protein